MTNWPEKRFEENMQQHIDEIYRSVFTGLCGIERSTQESFDNNELAAIYDRDMAIDTILRFEDGSVLTMQEKSRKDIYRKYQEFTFEYYSNRHVGNEGQWFKIASQLFFYGYANAEENGYTDWWIINLPVLRIYLTKHVGIDELKRRHYKTNSPANSDFFYYKFSAMPSGCILYQSQSR